MVFRDRAAGVLVRDAVVQRRRDRGAISVYAQADDYHDIIKPRLKAADYDGAVEQSAVRADGEAAVDDGDVLVSAGLGDRVLVPAITKCGRCVYCQRGMPSRRRA